MATHRWLRTVVSRCGTLDIILVEGSEGLRNNWHVSQTRIDAHRAADLAKGFTWDEPDYVDAKWWAKPCAANDTPAGRALNHLI